MKKITKAIIPVGWMWTRFLPATKSQPKEMLPIIDKPTVQYIVESVVQAWIKDIILVTWREKRAIEDHFDSNTWLEANLAAKWKYEELEQIRSITKIANFAFVRQHEPLWDWHAILSALPFMNPWEDAVVVFWDWIMVNENWKNSIQQMLEVYEKTQETVILLSEVEKKNVKKFGVADIEDENNIIRIKNFVEKPDPENAPSNLVANGQYIVWADIFDILKTQRANASHDSELRLANAFLTHIKNGWKIFWKKMDWQWFDTWDKLGYLKATIYYAFQREDMKDKLLEYINSLK